MAFRPHSESDLLKDYLSDHRAAVLSGKPVGNITPLGEPNPQNVMRNVVNQMGIGQGWRLKKEGIQKYGPILENIASSVAGPLGFAFGRSANEKVVGIPYRDKWGIEHDDYHLGLPGGGLDWTWTNPRPDPRSEFDQKLADYNDHVYTNLQNHAMRNAMQLMGGRQRPQGGPENNFSDFKSFGDIQRERFDSFGNYGKHMMRRVGAGINNMLDFYDYNTPPDERPFFLQP